VAVSSSNNSIRKQFLLRLALWPKISQLSWDRTSGRESKFCLKIMWTACVPVSMNKMCRSFQLRSDQVHSDKCSSSIACHAESNRHCPVNDSKFLFVVLKTSVANICFCCFHLFSDRNHNVNSMPVQRTSCIRHHSRHSTWLTKRSRS